MKTLAEQKVEYARELFSASSDTTSSAVKDAVKEKFGSGMGTYAALRIMHEVRGTKPRKRPRKKLAKKAKTSKKKKATKKRATRRTSPPSPKPNGLVPIPIKVEAQSSVDVLVRALVRAMRDEGIESLTIRADGRGRAYQLVGRDLDVGA